MEPWRWTTILKNNGSPKSKSCKMFIMKKMLTICLSGFIALGFASCEKEKDYAGRLNLQVNPLPTASQASIQYYNSTLNSVRTYVYVDNILASGTATTYATSPLYPGTSPSYIAVSPGQKPSPLKIRWPPQHNQLYRLPAIWKQVLTIRFSVMIR